MRKLLIFLAISLFIAAVVTSKPHKRAQIENPAVIFNNEKHFVAHRGESGSAPENTIPAFEAAGVEGFWGIETDVSETSDGGFVCMHDETIDRTTTGSGQVGEYSIKQIMKFDIDVGSNIDSYENLKIPKLDDFLSICRKYNCVAVIEVKQINNYGNFIKLLNESGCPVIITGGIDSLKEIRRINRSYPLMVIGYSPNEVSQYMSEVNALGSNCGLLLNHPMLDNDAVKLIKSKNYYLGVWTVNDSKSANKFFNDYGVDFIVADSAASMKK